MTRIETNWLERITVAASPFINRVNIITHFQTVKSLFRLILIFTWLMGVWV